jgi:glycopeptide antibiotics resistance protein
LPHWSLLLFSVSVLFIFYVTLTPFDFRMEHWGARNLVKEFFRHSSDYQDLVSNILLFLPIGLAWAAWLYRQSLARNSHNPYPNAPVKLWRLWLRTILLSFLLTLTVELLQVFLPTRYTSYRDLVTNTLGGTIGAAAYLFGTRYHLWVQGWQQLQRLWRSPQAIAGLLLAWVLLGCGLTLSLHQGNTLSNWARDYPLVIGNEPSGDRPWQGQVERLVISPTASSEAAIAAWLNQPKTAELTGAIADYDFTRAAPYRSRLGSVAPIDWNQPNSTPTSEITQADRWLMTQTSPEALIDPIRNASSFTLATMVRASSFDHEETARIISISQDPYHRNLTLGQEGDYLTVRLRTPITGKNGTHTSLGVPNVFVDRQPHALLLTYESGNLSLYVDQIQNQSTLTLRPEVTLFRFLLPWNFLQFNLTPRGRLASRLIYYALFSGPLGLWVGRLLQLSRGKSLRVWGLLGAGLLLPCGLFAQFLGQTLIPSPLIWASCLGLSGLACSILYWRSAVLGSWGVGE